MFTWLGHKMGLWADNREEAYCREHPTTIYFGGRWVSWASVGFLVDLFLFCALVRIIL